MHRKGEPVLLQLPKESTAQQIECKYGHNDAIDHHDEDDDVIGDREYIQIKENSHLTKRLGTSGTFFSAATSWTRYLSNSLNHHGNYPKFWSKNKIGLCDWITTVLVVSLCLLTVPSPSSADYYADYVSIIMKNYSKSACDGEYLRIDCPEGTSIHVLTAMYGRKVPSSEMCPSGGVVGSGEVEEDVNCEAKTARECEEHRICRLLVHRRVFGMDPCPETNKYLTVQYTCAPGDFRERSTCMEQNVRFRCRQDTVISVYDVALSETPACSMNVNLTSCTMTSEHVLEEVSGRCHAREKCSYTLPRTSCYNHVKIIHTCVPKELLTSELPSSVRLLATTVTSETTAEATTITTVQSTVTTLLNHKGETTFVPVTSSQESTTSLIVEPSLRDVSDNLTASTAANYDIITSFTNLTTTHRTREDDDNDAISRDTINNHSDSDITVHNDFPMPPKDMDLANSSTGTSVICINCSSTVAKGKTNFMTFITNIYSFVQDNSDDLIIAVLLGVVVALLLTIIVLVFPCRCKRAKKTKGTRTTTAESRPSIEEEEEYRLPAPLQEETDEHENMSLLGSILQRSVSSSNTVHHHISPNHTNAKPLMDDKTGEDGKTSCGPNSIFGKICCTCCCSNAPWQRTRILKRHRGDVYRVTHRYSSSQEDDEVEGRYHSNSHEPFPVFSRGDENGDNRSPGPILEDHVNRTEYPIVTSAPHHHQSVTSQSQQQSNFRPISRNAQRHYSTTPEPDQPYRTNHTFHPHSRLDSQRSDNALNIYSTQLQHNPQQVHTAPTSPQMNHQPKRAPRHDSRHERHLTTSPASMSAAHASSRSKRVTTPTSPRVVHAQGHELQQPPTANSHIHTPTSPRMRKQHKYDQYHTAQQYPTFTEAYEQYDNSQQHYNTTQHARMQDHYNHHPYTAAQQQQYMQHHQYNTNNGHYPGYYQPNHNPNYGDHFVQAAPMRTVPSNARTVDLAANARTVDLSHNNSLSRNSWLEIRRSSFYDNSLPRNSDMYEYYQQLQQQHELHQNQQHLQHLQQELPGSRSLNQYYP